MKLTVKLSDGELIGKLPIMPLVEMTQSGWKTFSCKRRINEYCDETGWKMLEEAIQEARTLYKALVYQQELNIEVARWERLKILLPWAASIVHYGTTGKL